MASSEGGREIAAAKKRLAAAEARAAADAKAVQVAKAAEASAREMAEMAQRNAQTAANNREGAEAQAEASAKEAREARKCVKDAEMRWEVVAIDDDSDADESETVNKKFRFCDKGKWGTYDGELNEGGKRHGKGKMSWDKGGWYEGQWKNDMREGQGTLKCPRGVYEAVWEGQWKNNALEGQGMTHRFRLEKRQV
ncbi:hypothetical protein ACHAXT_000554 [Thalassiosira profunda]